MPLFAALAIEPGTLERLPQFRRRMEWYLKYRPTLVGHSCLLTRPGDGGHLLLAVADREKLERILPRVLDPEQFLSDYGLRSMSKGLAAEPYTCHGGVVSYEPAESSAPMYGGNSNWRGPIWFPVNYLMIEALREYDRYFGDSLRVELPRGSGPPGDAGPSRRRAGDAAWPGSSSATRHGAAAPVFGDNDLFQADPHWRDHIPFYEYFHGEDGAGLGASHQTGWTALVAELIRPCGGPASDAR